MWTYISNVPLCTREKFKYFDTSTVQTNIETIHFIAFVKNNDCWLFVYQRNVVKIYYFVTRKTMDQS